MAKCIFCLTTNESSFNTLEHILPESLGGGDWAILPSGMFCDQCQNKFGSTIEQQALADYPFINMRTILSIPTKKRKAPWMENWVGKFYSGGRPGLYTLDPNHELPLSSGSSFRTLFPAASKKPEMILRTLLKIGLEVIACNGTEAIYHEHFNHARTYALTGKKDKPWFYIQIESLELLNKYLSANMWTDVHKCMEIIYSADGCVWLRIRIYYLEFVVPLVANVYTDFLPNEPLERLIIV